MEMSPQSASKQEGLRLLQAGAVDDAIAVLENVLESNPDDAETHTYLGAAYNQKDDKLHAVHHFEESVRLQETPRSYYNLGLVYEASHRIDEAVRQYRMAAELDPNYVLAQQALKRLHDRFEAEHQGGQDETGAFGQPPAP